MKLHRIFLTYLSLILYSTPINSLATKTLPQHLPIPIPPNTSHLNFSNELTIASNVAQLLTMLSRSQQSEYRKATLFNVQISVNRPSRPSNQIADFRSIACWFRSGAPPPGLILYNAFIVRNGAPSHWDRWRSPELVWFSENWSMSFSLRAVITTFMLHSLLCDLFCGRATH